MEFSIKEKFLILFMTFFIGSKLDCPSVLSFIIYRPTEAAFHCHCGSYP